jgi:ATP-dependent DNA helicase RecG
MSTAPDIPNLLAQGMGPDLHWFPEDVPVTRLAAALVGMANMAGGTVLLGIAPRSGQIQGVQEPAEAIDRVFQAALLVDPPLVLPVPNVYTIKTDGVGVNILWIAVPPGLPHVYSLDGSYLGREGRQTNPLSARKLRQLLIERGSIQLELRLPSEAALDDLDPDQVRAYAKLLHERTAFPEAQGGASSPEEILLRRGCLQRVDGELRPTYAALLLFGRYPQQWLPNATLLAARFSGETFTDRFIKQEIRGTLPEQLRQAEAFVLENLHSVVHLVGLTRQETLEYPAEAVRELLVNAVAHRDYNVQGDNIHLNLFSDRLEVQSPGGLPGPVTLENLLEARFSRNAILAQVLSDLGFVERLGYGLDRVVAVVRQHNMRPPRFEETAGCFRVTLFSSAEAQQVSGVPIQPGAMPDLSAYQGLALNPRQEAALSYLAVHRRITNSAFQELCPEVHPETLRRDLVVMIKHNLLIKVGDKKATYYILK